MQNWFQTLRRLVSNLATLYISRSTTFSYTSENQLQSINGPREDVSDITTFSYYPNTAQEGLNRGQLHTVSNALNQVITYGDYNALGKPERIIDASQTVTTLNYDDQGRLTSRTTASQTTTYQYDNAGRIDLITMPDNRILDYRYDGNGHLEKIVDSNDNFLQFSYDPVSGKISQRTVHKADGTLTAEVAYSYDSSGRLFKEFFPAASNAFTQRNYDAAGNLVSLVNALGKETSYSFDELDRIIAIIKPGTVTTGFSYDSYDNQKEITDGNDLVTTLSYDDFGRRISRNSPDSGITSYVYDAADNLISETDATGVTINRSYDALNRLVAISYPKSAENVVLSYDENGAIGQLTTRVDASGTTVYSYDTLGRCIEETRTHNDQSFVTSYSYTEGNMLQTINYPSGRELSYQYDAAGYVSSVSTMYQGVSETIADGISYLPFGPMHTMTLGNGLVITNSYDTLYRLTTSSAAVYDRTYSYYQDSTIQSISDALDATRNQNFSYDDLGRLIEASGKYGTISYQYDDNGNRISRADNSGVSTYNYKNDSNILESLLGPQGNIFFSHTANGWMRIKKYQVLLQNASRHLGRAFLGNNQPLNDYTYNASRQRVASIRGGVYHYDLAGNLIAETSSSGEVKREYVWLDGKPLAQITSDGSLYYYHNDHLGTPQLLTDATGAVAWAAEYLPFGKATITVENVTNNLRFPGQYYDWETGLHYNWNRYYDPETGRYISADPIGLRGGMNLYAYVKNDPVNAIDPKGLHYNPVAEHGMDWDTIIPPRPQENGFTHGWEGHIIIGGGQFYIECCDKNSNEKLIHQYRKICLGAAIDVSYGAGYTSGMDRTSCSDPPQKLLGGELGVLFVEGGVSVDMAGSGVGGSGGGSGGIGIGGVKATACFYFYMFTEYTGEKCKCDN